MRANPWALFALSPWSSHLGFLHSYVSLWIWKLLQRCSNMPGHGKGQVADRLGKSVHWCTVQTVLEFRGLSTCVCSLYQRGLSISPVAVPLTATPPGNGKSQSRKEYGCLRLQSLLAWYQTFPLTLSGEGSIAPATQSTKLGKGKLTAWHGQALHIGMSKWLGVGSTESGNERIWDWWWLTWWKVIGYTLPIEWVISTWQLFGNTYCIHSLAYSGHQSWWRRLGGLTCQLLCANKCYFSPVTLSLFEGKHVHSLLLLIIPFASFTSTGELLIKRFIDYYQTA